MNDENDVVLLGNFNLSPDEEGFDELLEIPDMIYVNGEISTSIKDRLRFCNSKLKTHGMKLLHGIEKISTQIRKLIEEGRKIAQY